MKPDLKTELQEMSVFYRQSELDALRKLRKFPYGKVHIDEMRRVAVVDRKYDVDGFVNKFFQDRGIKAPRHNNAIIAAFDEVPMHTDHISTSNYLTLIFPIKGHGELIYFKNRTGLKTINIIHRDFLEDAQYPIIFDDTLPHSFCCDRYKCKRCVAILVNVHIDTLKELFGLRKEQPFL